MKDLILDKLIGKELSRFLYDDPDCCLRLLFADGSRLICYHDQECCESVSFVANRNDNFGIVESYSLEETSELDEKDLKRLKKNYRGFDFTPGYRDSYTITELRLNFEGKKINSFLFIGESNGYYSESISFRWEK